MMKMNETTLSFLENDCVQQFGNEKGTTIFQRAEIIYQQLLNKADYRNSAAIQNHLQFKMFPTMAYYKALRAEGISQEKALEYVRKETHKAASVQKEEMSKLGNMLFAYTFYRLGVKKHMRKNFPDEGWKTEWIKCNGKEIHFNLHSCIYCELTNMYECPELCCVYCENDDISFSGLLPQIRFERTGTLGSGSPYCDFHFIKA
ncbi:MAG: L-2-amino-thiazoline-4-carboxylic acid hydrolase [Lachnospiraceae bacterium]|nr:L-2-amino-thiazoline-4-carboxylic acid hydrolase [Lachnospiraceae bacterium]